MIVYFSKKSKNTLFVFCFTLGFLSTYAYGFFVYVQMHASSKNTIQIVPKGERGTTPFDQKGDSGATKTPSLEYLFVASKKGTYYYPISCSKARTLSVKNMLYFKDKMSAQGAGYKPYNGCK